MRVRLASMVLTLMYRVAAISGLLRPEVTSSAIRHSARGSMGAFRARGESRALRVGKRLPPLGAQGAENGGCFVEGGSGPLALAGFALRGAEHEQTTAELERQSPLARLGDDRGDRPYSRGRVVLGEPQGGFGAAGGDPRPRVVQAPRRLLQPGQPVGCAPREETSCPSFPAPSRESVIGCGGVVRSTSRSRHEAVTVGCRTGCRTSAC